MTNNILCTRHHKDISCTDTCPFCDLESAIDEINKQDKEITELKAYIAMIEKGGD